MGEDSRREVSDRVWLVVPTVEVVAVATVVVVVVVAGY